MSVGKGRLADEPNKNSSSVPPAFNPAAPRSPHTFSTPRQTLPRLIQKLTTFMKYRQLVKIRFTRKSSPVEEFEIGTTFDSETWKHEAF